MKNISIWIGKTRVNVEIAESPLSKALGLMFRKEMKQGSGMVFDFGKDQKPGMWMAFMNFPIDIIFVSDSMRVVDIKENCKPWARKIFSPRIPARYVIEVSAGFCQRNNITSGKEVLIGG